MCYCIQCAYCLECNITWEDMTNYAGQREQFIDNYGPQNEAQNDTSCAKVFKMFFDGGTNSARNKHLRSTKIQATSFISLRSRMRDWKPVTKDEMYVVLALFMLMGIIQKPTLRSYLKKINIYFGDSNLWFNYFYGSV